MSDIMPMLEVFVIRGCLSLVNTCHTFELPVVLLRSNVAMSNSRNSCAPVSLGEGGGAMLCVEFRKCLCRMSLPLGICPLSIIGE